MSLGASNESSKFIRVGRCGNLESAKRFWIESPSTFDQNSRITPVGKIKHRSHLICGAQRKIYLKIYLYVSLKRHDFRLLREPEAYSEPCQTSKMKLCVKIANSWKLKVLAKKSILDVWQFTEYTMWSEDGDLQWFPH